VIDGQADADFGAPGDKAALAAAQAAKVAGVSGGPPAAGGDVAYTAATSGALGMDDTSFRAAAAGLNAPPST